MSIKCPNCESVDKHPALWNVRNFGRIALELLIECLKLNHVDELRLHRQCQACGHRYLARNEYPPDFDECPQCGYDLTENVSGRCSECGWELQRRYREYRAKVECDTSTTDRTEP